MLLAMLCSVALVARGQDYAINLSRPAKVGDKARVHLVFGIDRSSSSKLEGAQDANEQKTAFKVELDGVNETLAVDKRGEESKFQITIDRCVKIEGDNTTELIPRGGILIAENKGEETQLSLKDGTLSDDANEALRNGIQAHASDEPTDDDIFGSKQRRKVGETWPVNAKALAKIFQRSKMNAEPRDISGTCRLARVSHRDGIPSLQIECDFEVKNLTMPGPENAEQTRGTFRGAFAGLFPQDPSLPALADSQAEEMELSYKIPTPDGQSAVLKSRWQRTIESKVTPIKQ